MSARRVSMGLLLCALILGPSARERAAAQQAGARVATKAGGGYRSLDELHAAYSRKLAELDRQRVADLAALASRQQGEEAEEACRELLNLAIARNLYGEAEAAARRCRQSASDPQLKALATLVAVVARANRGEYDQSQQELMEFIREHQIPADPERRIDPSTATALGEAYLQRLIRAGRYDNARQICKTIIEKHPDRGVKEHFTARLGRLDMLGKAAPPIEGQDVDGKTVRLADLKGKVVLVDFWATWCPPCLAAVPELKEVASKYRDKGFVILGVNLDAQRKDVGSVEKASPVVRRFLLAAHIAWPNVLVGDAANDPTKAYDVDEIPARFLVDREGKIVDVEQTGEELDKAIARALGGGKGNR
jgi:thiol-disulfide isomerase/thioredoxin